MAADLRREVVVVVAVADNGVIGNQGGMPWHAPADLRRFKSLTMGHPIVMGRKTFDSIGRPLPGRHNIVITRNPGWTAEGVTAVGSLDAAFSAAEAQAVDKAAIMVIGGSEVFAQWLPLATRAEITRLHINPPGDAFWPPLDENRWERVGSEALLTAEPAMTFETWRRLAPDPVR